MGLPNLPTYSSMELRHLRYFVVVAEELNFCRAAERLRIAQPPLSVQIRHLEEELGAQLFYRVKRRITLSPAGEVLFSQGRRLLREAEQIAEQVREAASGKTGSLSIGFVGTAMYDILPGALRIFRSMYPKIQLNLEDDRYCECSSRHYTAERSTSALSVRQFEKRLWKQRRW